MSSVETKVVHLTDIIAKRAMGADALEDATRDGGILLDNDEGDILDLICQIDDDVVPHYYRGDWKAFLRDFLIVLKNATDPEIGSGDIISDIEHWIIAIQQDGRLMVA